MKKLGVAAAWLIAAATVCLSPALAQQGPPPAFPVEPGSAGDIFEKNCATCHGTTLAGGRGPSLFAESLLSETKDAEFVHTIREGLVAGGMPPFKDALKDEQINQIVAYMRVQGGRLRDRPSFLPDPNGQIIKSEKQTFKIEVVASNLNTPWGAAFLPDGRMVVSERTGQIRIIDHGKVSDPVKNTPATWLRQDSGYFDIAIHPDYKKNGWIYLSYMEVTPGVTPPPGDAPGTPRSQLGPAPLNMTRWVRGRINAANEWVNQEDVFRVPAELYTDSVIHYGSRFLFDGKGHLFITMGERGEKANAQNLSSPLGKIHRFNIDGSIPKDNPFVKTPGAVPSIWVYGVRNSEGLAFDPRTGLLWESDNGPIGGDEVNIIEKGHNYGWGVVSMGLEPGISKQHEAGMDDPITYYSPSIAPSGISFYTGARYPKWKNSLFLAALGGQKLLRYEINGRKITHEETVFKGFGRVRQVLTGPDGYLYVLIQNSQSLANSPGMVIRLLPQ